MISKNSIETLKNHIEVVDVISQFIELKKAGANFKACCPFHGESTPSFVVSPVKQIYHCFGCGVGGDAINFVKEYEKLSYVETIEKLASMYNFHLEYEEGEKKQEIKILEQINEYYKKLFLSNQTAREYILSRGISEYSIEKFEIGYASTSNDTISYLKNNFFNLGDAKDLGVIDSGTNGLYARFIERITFPIYALNSKIVGFGGRTITGHNAKYVNSPQTKIFNKSRLLYGYNLAKNSIIKKKEIIVTEGYLDVIMLHQAGFDNSVATLGTALTKEHLPLLRRIEPKVIIAYDGDKAGLNAAYKASLMLSQGAFEGGVVIFGEGKDPADMVKENRIEELENIFNSYQSFTPFVIDYIISKYEINKPEQKQLALNEVSEYLKTLSPIMYDEYAKYLSMKLNINPKLLKSSNNTENKKEFYKEKQKVDIAELQIIKTLLEKPSLFDFVLNVVDANIFKIHKHEFEILLNNKEDERLREIILKEEIKVYSDEELKFQIINLLIIYYNDMISKVKYDEKLSLKDVGLKIREYKEKILRLKRGDLS